MSRFAHCLVLAALGPVLWSALGAEEEKTAPAPEPIPIADLKRDAPVDFAAEIVPIFRKNCLACHNATEAKGELVLETPAAILKGGETGPAVVPGKSEESLLLKAASHALKPFMPPRNNKVEAVPLQPAELGLIKLWIDQGATGTVSTATAPLEWQPLPPELNPIYAVAVTPDGQYAACARANQIFIYHLPSSQLITRLSDPELVKTVKLPAVKPTTDDPTAGPVVADRDLIQALAFSPDGNSLASAGYREVKLWRRHANAPRYSLPYAAGQAGETIAASPDGKWIATAGPDPTIRIWEAPTGKFVRKLSGHRAAVTSLRFSPDSGKLASSALDKSVRIWSPESGHELERFETPASERSVEWLSGTRLASAGDDGLIRLWKFPTNAPAEKDPGPLAAGPMAISASGRLCALALPEGEIVIRSIDSGEIVKRWSSGSGEVLSLAFDPSDRFLAGSGADQSVRLWQTEDGQGRLTADIAEATLQVAVRAGGNELAAASGPFVKIFKAHPHPERIIGTNAAGVSASAISADGARLATALVPPESGPVVIEVRDLSSGQMLKVLTGHDAAVTTIAFNSDGTRLISGSLDKTARVWNLADGREISRFTGHTQAVTAVAFRPGAEQALSGSADHSLKLWNIYSRAVEKEFFGQQTPVTAVEMSPDGRLAVSASGQVVRVWKDSSITPLYSIACGSGITSLAVAGNRDQLAISEEDGTVKFCQLADGKLLQSWRGRGARTSALSYSPEQTRLLGKIGAEDLAIWDAGTGALLETIPVKESTFGFLHGQPDDLLVGRKDLTIVASPTHAPRLLFLTNAVAGVSYTPNGKLLLTATSDGAVAAWNANNFKLAFAFPTGAPLGDLACSPDGTCFATAGADGQLRFWNATNGAAVTGRAGAPLPEPVEQIRFAPASDRLAVKTRSGTYLVRRESGVIEQAYESQGGAPAAIGIGGTNGNFLLRTWEDQPPSRIEIAAEQQFGADADPIAGLALVPGKEPFLVSGSEHGEVRVWDFSRGKVVRKMKHRGNIASLAVRPDGKRIASAGSTGATLWNSEDGQAVAELKGDFQGAELAAKFERNLTLARAEVSHQKNLLQAAEARRETAAQTLKKSVETLDPAEKSVAAKKEAVKKAREEKQSTDKLLAEAAEQLKKAKETKESAETLLRNVSDASNKVAEAQASITRMTGEKAAAVRELLQLAAKNALRTENSPPGATVPEPPGAGQAAENPGESAEIAIEKLAKLQAALDRARAGQTAAEKVLAENAPKVSGLPDKASLEKALNESTKSDSEARAKAKTTDKNLTDAEAALKQAEAADAESEKSVVTALVALRKSEDETASARQAVELAGEAQKKVEVDLAAATQVSGEPDRPVRAVAFSADNQVLATAGDDQVVYTWNPQNGRAYDKFRAHGGPVLCLAYLRDGTLISGSADRSVFAWPPTGAWSLDRMIGTGDETSPLIDRVLALEFSPDGQWLATGGGTPSRNGELKIWRVSDGTLAREIKDAHSDTVFAVSFSPNNRFLASGAADKFVKVWDILTGKLVKTFEGHTHHVLGVSWKSDGRILASCGADRAVKVWDFVTGEQKKTIEGFNKEVTSIHFVEASNEALVTSGDDQVRLLREDGNNVRNFGGGTDFIQSAAITPDGQTVVAGSQDSTLRIWNGTNGELVKSFAAVRSVEAQKMAAERKDREP